MGTCLCQEAEGRWGRGGGVGVGRGKEAEGEVTACGSDTGSSNSCSFVERSLDRDVVVGGCGGAGEGGKWMGLLERMRQILQRW